MDIIDDLIKNVDFEKVSKAVTALSSDKRNKWTAKKLEKRARKLVDIALDTARLFNLTDDTKEIKYCCRLTCECQFVVTVSKKFTTFNFIAFPNIVYYVY